METSNFITGLALPSGLAFIMFAMGLTLKFGDFRQVFMQPRALVLGLFVQLVFLPLLAFALLQGGPLSPALAVGVMVLAASPGGITSNLLTHLARGDVALSVTLTALSSLLGMIGVPLVVGLSMAWFMPMQRVGDLSVGKMMVGVFLVSTLPVLTGLLARHLWPRGAVRLQALAGPLSVGIFLLIVLAAFVSSWQVMMAHIAVIGPLMLLLNGLVMLVGWRLARFGGFSRRQAVAISLEGGLQNGALGIFVAIGLLHDKTMMIPSITYALVMNFTAALLIIWRIYNNPNNE